MGLRPLNKLLLPARKRASQRLYNRYVAKCSRILASTKAGRESLPGPPFFDRSVGLPIAPIPVVVMMAAGDRASDHRADQRAGNRSTDIAVAVIAVAIIAGAIRRIAVARAI